MDQLKSVEISIQRLILKRKELKDEIERFLKRAI